MKNAILLVEDNPTDEKLTVLAFRECGVKNDVMVVRDGAEALDYLFATGEFAGRDARHLPTIVLLDLSLPRLSGLDVLQRIRADHRTALLPVVMLSSSTEQEDVIRSYSFGANAYVRKPVDFGEFAAAARTLGFFWLLLNEAPPARPPASEAGPT
jgi:two-component system response regulator